MTNLFIPPHSVEAEQSVLGGLLRDNDAFERVGALRSEHFYLGDNGIIFEAIRRQLLAGKSVDPISLAIALTGKIENAQQYLITLASDMPSAATIGRHAAIVRDKALKRAMILIGRDMIDLASTSTDDAALLIDSLSSKIEKLADARTKGEPRRASETIARHVEKIEARLDGTSRGISTGFPDLDRRIGGLRGGQVHIVGGRPKMGKTALALNVAANVADSGEPVLVLSQEMSEEELHDRNLATLGKIDLERLLEPKKLEEGDWSHMTHAITKINDMDLFLDDDAGLTLLDVRMKAKTVKRKKGLKLLVVDYLQLMVADGPNRNAQIEGISRGLKILAKELDITILLLSQLNRKVEERPNKRPVASDLRDSGSIEQDADAVWLIYRDEYYNPDTNDKGIVEVNIPLCRSGAPGTCNLVYIGEQTRFESVAHGWHPAPPKAKPRRGFTAD
jgi:replicative DNA helicase